MQPPAPPASTPLPLGTHHGWRSRPVEDIVYQVMTVCAILLILGSLWLF